MSSFSVVLGGLVSERKMMALISDLKEIPAVTEVLIPISSSSFEDPHFLSTFEAITSRFGDFLAPLVVEGESSPAAMLNQAVAACSNEQVCIMERPVFLSEIGFDLVAEDLGLSPRSVVLFKRRILSRPNIENASDSYFASAPERPSVRRGAYALKRRYFLEMRGFDESVRYSNLLGAEFIRRHEYRGGKLLQVPQRRGVVYSSPGSDNFTGFTELDVNQVEQTNSSDRSIYRNLIEWSVPADLRVPLVSVAIATKDRAELLGESISSVLYQSFKDFEIVVVDDGSEDPIAVRSVIDGFHDERILLLRNEESRGVSHARNRAADATDCLLTAVHDDDDLMLPHRLKWGVEALSDETDASYGAWTNFDDNDGTMRTFLTKRGFGSSLVAFNGSGPGHSTWTLPTEIVRVLRYNESLTSAVDHYFATRSAAAGVRWSHVQRVMYLRRVHELQITSQDSDGQKSGHLLSKIGNRFLASPAGFSEMKDAGKRLPYPSVEGAKDPEQFFSGYLPDHLVTRDVLVFDNVSNTLMDADFPSQMVSVLEDRDMVSGTLHAEQALLRSMTLEDLVQLRKAGVTKWKAIGKSKGDTSENLKTPSINDDQMSLAEARAKVKEQGSARLRLIFNTFRKQYKEGHLVVFWSEALSDPPSIDLNHHPVILQRRVLVKGELGASLCLHIFGLRDFAAALSLRLELPSPKRECALLIVPSVSPDLLVEELFKIKEHQLVSHSTDDSGLEK